MLGNLRLVIQTLLFITCPLFLAALLAQKPAALSAQVRKEAPKLLTGVGLKLRVAGRPRTANDLESNSTVREPEWLHSH